MGHIIFYIWKGLCHPTLGHFCVCIYNIVVIYNSHYRMSYFVSNCKLQVSKWQPLRLHTFLGRLNANTETMDYLYWPQRSLLQLHNSGSEGRPSSPHFPSPLLSVSQRLALVKLPVKSAERTTDRAKVAGVAKSLFLRELRSFRRLLAWEARPLQTWSYHVFTAEVTVFREAESLTTGIEPRLSFYTWPFTNLKWENRRCDQHQSFLFLF